MYIPKIVFGIIIGATVVTTLLIALAVINDRRNKK